MQHENHKNAKNVLKQIEKYPEKHLIIHYSCESFYTIKDGHTPRVTSIAVRSYHTTQTDSFSILKIAEKKHIPLTEIPNKVDELEKEMLCEYYDFVGTHPDFLWIHWSMRDINFGFKAIDHRFEVLGGTPVIIPNQSKIDLAKLLKDYFGENYISHPRMEKIVEKNNLRSKSFLSGREEAIAYEEKDYIKLHQSTLKKVDIFSDIIHRILNNNLKVDSGWKEMYGTSVQGIYESLAPKWWWQILLLVLGGVIGHCFAPFFS